ncbi:hypothetical protein ASZ90_020264 [hydrocarbon metagenome]|uniref:Uncharacterized protein n=1 Tax=hydrocarbon metagenome TaxID=938273 RepID=A0A0W8E178_9ZZZZ
MLFPALYNLLTSLFYVAFGGIPGNTAGFFEAFFRLLE